MHVPLLGRVRPDRVCADDRATHLFERREHILKVQTLSAVLLGNLWREQISILRLLPEPLEFLGCNRLAGRKRLSFTRKDDFFHERLYSACDRFRRVGIVVFHVSTFISAIVSLYPLEINQC